jgi:predicted amidophosphoribosyltransferase
MIPGLSMALATIHIPASPTCKVCGETLEWGQVCDLCGEKVHGHCATLQPQEEDEHIVVCLGCDPK